MTLTCIGSSGVCITSKVKRISDTKRIKISICIRNAPCHQSYSPSLGDTGNIKTTELQKMLMNRKQKSAEKDYIKHKQFIMERVNKMK